MAEEGGGENPRHFSDRSFKGEEKDLAPLFPKGAKPSLEPFKGADRARGKKEKEEKRRQLSSSEYR